MTAKSADPKRNAGICLTGAEIAKLDEYKTEAGLSRSQVVALLIDQLPTLWWELHLNRKPQAEE